MNNKRNKRKSYVFRSWIISNLILLMMPLLFGISFYLIALGTITNEITNVNMVSLRNFKCILDGQFAELEKTVNTIAASKNIKSLPLMSKQTTGRDQRNILRVQDELSGFHATSMIDEIYIYINDSCIITCTNKFNEFRIPSICEDIFCMDTEEFLSLTTEKNYDPFRLTSYVGESGNLQTAILYIRPFYIIGCSKPAGTIVIRLRSSSFLSLLNNLELADHSDVLLINALDESCEKDSNQKYRGMFSYQSLHDSPQISESGQYMDDTTIAHIPSDILNIEYVSVMSTSYAYQEVALARRQMFIYLALCLLLGGFTAYAFAKRNYDPLGRMKRMLLDRMSTDEKIEDSHHEFSIMEGSLKSLLDTEKQVHDIQKQNMDAHRNNLLICLLKRGYLDAERALLLLVRHGISLSSDSFIVITVKLINFSDSIGGEYEDDENVRTLIGSMIQSMGEGFLDGPCVSCMADVDGMMAFIVNYDGNEHTAYGQCKESAAKLAAFAHESLGMELNVAVSSEHYGAQEIADAYAETLLAFEYQTYINDPEPVVCYDVVNNDTKLLPVDTLDLAKQRKLINCLESKDYQTAREVFDDVLNTSLSSIGSIQAMKIRAFALMNILLSTFDFIQQKQMTELLEEMKPVDRLLNAKSNDEFCNEMRIIFNFVIETLQRCDQEKDPDFIADTESYVYTNFRSPELSVSEIADKLNISVSYLSRSYKRCRGIGLLDFIHKVRIDASKELLGGMSICEVAKHVGYYNDKTFIRVYKKFEGITPGKTRNYGGEA